VSNGLPCGSKNEAALNASLRYVEVLDFPDQASLHHAKIRGDLKTLGTMIGANDLFIAAHARNLGLMLVTNYTREFGRVRDLAIENWALAAYILFLAKWVCPDVEIQSFESD
jgi:tRNA(fMet)-specific endonuclease VapC